MKKTKPRKSASAKKNSAGATKGKKGKARNKLASAKAQGLKDVELYFSRVPEPVRGTLNKLRAAIKSVIPAEAFEAISYGIPAFKYKGSLVGYAAFANHFSLFPMGSSILEKFKVELQDYQTSKGTLRFPFDKPLPVPLIKKIVKAAVARQDKKNQG
jgi:uncharacterized protein YdhG (YjbR/CyaY superfamily)